MTVDFDINHFGRWLKATLALKGMSQADLAECANVTQASVSGWVRGLRMPNFKELKKILDALNMHIEVVNNRAD